MPSSYANTIKAQYNNEINTLKKQLESQMQYYDEQIGYLEYLIKGLEAEQKGLPKQMQSEFAKLDVWYAQELEKIYNQ